MSKKADDYTILRRFEDSCSYAEKFGCELVALEKDQVGLDFDDIPAYDVEPEPAQIQPRSWSPEPTIEIPHPLDVELNERLEFLRRVGIPIWIERWTTSKSRKGRHCYLRVGINLSEEALIAVQAILGSDWRREACALASLVSGDLYPRRLFEVRNAQD